MILVLNVLKHISFLLWIPYASTKMMKKMVDSMTHMSSTKLQNFNYLT